MPSPIFFHPNLSAPGATITLDEEASKHIVSVLRMQAGDTLILADGLGHHAQATISVDHRKRCEVRVSDIVSVLASGRQLTLAVSPLKNASRFEWLLEKATEIGVARIVPLVCHRTERTHLRQDRLRAILVSAMLQSQQAWLPRLDEPTSFGSFVDQASPSGAARLIAHCMEGEKEALHLINDSLPDARVMLVGPEGDFTPEELTLALEAGYRPVGLGTTRLRTETAAFVAAVHLMY